MSSCREFQGLIAASLYEPLDGSDSDRLQAHLGHCLDCAKTYSAMQTMVSTVPNEPVEFTGDLLPAIRESLRQRPAYQGLGILQKIVGIAAFALVIGCVAFYAIAPRHGGEGGMSSQNPMELALKMARERTQAGDFVGARTTLEEHLVHVAGTEDIGIIHLEIANLEFDSFRRYGLAYSSYELVRNEFQDVWSKSSGQVKARFDLLTEAREENFEPLNQMDLARSQGESGIATLETLVAKYPGRTLATEALTTMASLVDPEDGNPLEVVKARCTNPLTVAQIDVRLGEEYWQKRNNPTRGRELLEAVAQGPHEIPAKMARETLARLEPGTRP